MNTFDTRPPAGYPGSGYAASGYPSAGYASSSDYTQGGKQTYGQGFVLNARVNFVRKVFSIVSIQLMVTAYFVYLSAYSKHYMKYVHHSPLTTFGASCGAMISMLALTFWKSLARKAPLNYCILGYFTLCQAYLTSKITSNYDTSSIFGAIFLTAAIVSALTLYACTTKHEITYFMGLIAMLTMGSFFMMFVRIVFHGSFTHLITSLIASTLAGLYLIYDIKAIMGHNGMIKVDIDDYVGGALSLYVDIIQIFVRVLHILGDKNEEKNRKKGR